MNPIETRYLFSMPMQVTRWTMGATPLGQRRYIAVTEATIDGPDIKAKLLPGGCDWATDGPDGPSLMDCRLLFQTDDDALIGMWYHGVRHAPPAVAEQIARGEAVDPTSFYHRVAIRFETAAARYARFNRMMAIGRARPREIGAVYEVFEVL